MLIDASNEKLSSSMSSVRCSSEKTKLVEWKSLKMQINRSTFVRLFVLLLIATVVFNRTYFVCLFGFVNCYLTWPFSSPEHIRLDLSTLSIDRRQNEIIPRRIHHILLGPLSGKPPLNWLMARNSCLEIHSNYDEFFLWNDKNSELFLSEHYPQLLNIWNSYRTVVQKADALRYVVLYHYGGIFLDMDLFCRQSLNGIVNHLEDRIGGDKHMFLAVKAFPVGISNGFMITSKGHSLLRQVIDNLGTYHRNFLVPHATIVISTGPMFISIQIQLNRSLWKSILVLDGKENMLGGKTDTPLFRHLGSGSWHQADETLFKNIPMNIQHQSQTFSIAIIFIVTFLILIFLGKQRNSIKAFVHRHVFH